MPIEFRNTNFVNLFGDPDRPIYGDEVVIPVPPSPTPSVTPTITPTITPTLTPTPTPSATPPPQGYAEANAYLEAVVNAGGTGITSNVSADTRTFFATLYSIGVWDKLVAFYPFIGGTADAHKFNGKDPRDLDAAYRITWYGGMTHDYEGIKPNGSNAFGNTHLVPYPTIDGNNEGAIGAYLRTTATTKTFACEVGMGYYNISYTLVNGLPNYGQNDNVGGIPADTNIGSGISGLTAGFNLHNRVSSSSANMYSNKVDIGALQAGSAFDLLTGGSVVISALRLLQGSGAPDGDGGGLYSYSDRPLSFVFFASEGFTTQEMEDFTDAVNQYQFDLNRDI